MKSRIEIKLFRVLTALDYKKVKLKRNEKIVSVTPPYYRYKDLYHRILNDTIYGIETNMRKFLFMSVKSNRSIFK